MYYEMYFPKEKPITTFKTNRLGFAIGKYDKLMYNGTMYIDDSIFFTPSEINIKILSNNYYTPKKNKYFTIPMLNNKITNKKLFQNLLIKPFSRIDMNDIILNDSIFKLWVYITPRKNYNFLANNLYISTIAPYVTALTCFINSCNFMYFINNKHTNNRIELIEWCDYFNLSYEMINDNTLIKVSTANKEVMLNKYRTFSMENHIQNIINDTIIYPDTLTEFLTEVI